MLRLGQKWLLISERIRKKLFWAHTLFGILSEGPPEEGKAGLSDFDG